MRVLWLRPDKPSNISVGRHRIAEILEGRGHDVTVRNTTFSDFVDVLDEPADVVVGTTRLGAQVAVWRRLVRRTPAVVDHIDPISQFRRHNGRVATGLVGAAESVAFRLADHVMVVYEEAVPRVERYAREYTKTTLGVDYERFADPSSDAIDAAREHLREAGLDDDRRRVVYVGGLESTYNVETVADAMAHLPDWDFLVLGDGSKRATIERHPRDNVHYLGTVPHEHVPGYLHESDVGVNLLDDPNTLKILEYGAAGIPAVNLEGDVEDRFGDLVEYCSLDPEDVAAAIDRAARRDDVEKFRAFTREYSWESVADDYEAAFERVVR